MTLHSIMESSAWALYIILLGFIFLGVTLLFFRSGLSFLIQLLILVLFIFFGSHTEIGLLLATLQILFSVYLLYRLKKAIDYNYQLVIEKTHEIPPNITKNNNGSKATFL